MENMPIGIRHHLRKTIIVILLLSLSFPDCSQCMKTESVLSRQSRVDAFVSSASYQEHDPISIQGNAEFASLASSESWPGNGSESNPYLIHGLNITEEIGVGYPFRIRDTTVFFILNGSLLVGGVAGIRFSNVTNARINGSLVRDSSQYGIMIDYCSNISLNKNGVKSSQGRGIYLYRSEGMLLENCDVHSCKDRGILVDYTETSIIQNCSIHDNSRDGMHLRDSSSTIIRENSVFENGFIGIILGNADKCSIINNSIFNNSDSGMDVGDSFELSIIGNAVSNHIGAGMKISGESDNATVTNNTFYRNSMFALRTHADHGLFSMNNFIENRDTSPYDDDTQASDIGSNNDFVSNFWDEWVAPDENSDGTVDFPYDMYENMDPTPNVKAYPTNRIHILTRPWLIHPNETMNGGFFYGEMNITWTPASDTFQHEVTYSLFYVDSSTSEQEAIARNLTDTHFLWNTASIQQNRSYRLHVDAHCSGYLQKSSSEGPMLHILEHILTPPTILFPNGGEIITDDFVVEWETAEDSWNSTVTYNLWVSSDNGDTWTEVAEDLTKTNYLVAGDMLSDGSRNLVKVVAYSSNDFFSEDISDGRFTIATDFRIILTYAAIIGLVGITGAVAVLILRKRFP